MTKRAKSIRRRDTRTFAGLPHAVLQTHKYASLSSGAVKLLVDITAQYNGHNNGDLQASWSVLKQRGWRSRETLSRAIKELRDVGFIITTRQGGRNRCSLYAVTWQPVNECRHPRTGLHKLDVPATRMAPGSWRDHVDTREAVG